MTTRDVHRHGRNGETSSNRVTFSHVTAEAKKQKKEEQLEVGQENIRNGMVNKLMGSSMRQNLFSWQHVAIWKGFVTAQPHNERLR